MNTSNRFELETIARQHQAEIEKSLRQIRQPIDGSHFGFSFTRLSDKLTTGAVTLGIVSLAAMIIVMIIK